jgi:lipopolysaccharide export system protein LptC
MKHLPGQLFPIALLGIIAALTFWLQAALTPQEAAPDRRKTHDPDAIAENFEIRRLDDQGRLKYRLSAPYLAHFPDDDSSDVHSPRLIAYRQDAPSITLTANQAKITARGETVLLHKNVELLRPATEKAPALHVSTPTLTIEPELGIAYTDQNVRITQGASWLTGTGAHIDNNASTFLLQSNVRGHHVSSRVKP